MHKNLLFVTSIFLFVACTNAPSRSSSESQDSVETATDTLVENVLEARTVRGFVGTGTSMNTIELVSVGATDTLWLELDDETVRDATLEVGREIVALVSDGDDGSLHVLATRDAEEGQ